MPEIPPASASAPVAVAAAPAAVSKPRLPPASEPQPSRKPERRLRTWWWLAFLPLAVLAGGVGGLLWRTHHAGAQAGMGETTTVAPLASAAEGWRWLFTEEEWRDRSHGIGQFSDGLLQFHGSIGRPQPAPDGAIRARVVMRGPLPQPVSVYLRDMPGGQVRWVLDPAQRDARLLLVTNGQERELGKYRLAKPLVDGDRVLLELRAAGADITGLINGVEVVHAQDPRGQGEGQWGVTGDGVRFEVVEVTAPNSEKAAAAAVPPVPIAPPVEKPSALVAAVAPATPAAAPAPETPRRGSRRGCRRDDADSSGVRSGYAGAWGGHRPVARHDGRAMARQLSTRRGGAI